MNCRRYELICVERATAQAEFWNAHPRRSGRRWDAYPIHLEEIPPFSERIRKEVEDEKESGIVVPEEVEDSSKLPSLRAQRFRSMYAYGYHFWVKSAERSFSRTCDFGVAVVFHRPYQFGRRDQNPEHAAIEYIGQILEIVELNYGWHSIVLLVCKWMKVNYRDRNATVKKDEWEFTLLGVYCPKQ